MVACRYEIPLLVFQSTSHSFASQTRELSSRTLEEKFHINARLCIILYLSCAVTCNNVTSVSVEELARTKNTAVRIFFGKIGNTFNRGYLHLYLQIIWLPNICSY